jgi:PAS domain S-box-containing protein
MLGALPFSFAVLFGALWAVGISLEVVTVDASTKIFWVKFQAAWLLASVTAVTCFVLEYAWPGRWLTRRNLVLLSIPPLLFLGLILTNDFHHLMWRGFVINEKVIPLRGAGAWMQLAYAYGLTIVNIIVFGWLFQHSPQHRWPVVLMLAGQIAGRVVIGLEAVQVIQSDLHIEVIAFWFPISMYVIALFGFRIFDPIPLARQTVIEQLRDGMLVLDTERRVVSLNPAAEIILGASFKHVQGKPIGELLPGFAELGSPLTGTATPSKPLEMDISLKGEAHCYELNFSPLHDFRGLPIGHLLLLHDVTEQRRSQAQILEQQRALATLSERERLARELHDSIGQVLGYVSLQAQAIRRRAQGGDLPAVVAQLTRLAEVAQAAHADVRDSILSLKAGAGPVWSFQAALRQYLDAYRDQYGIRTELSLPEGWVDGLFEPETEVQLLRVIQEALTNARKHGKAGCVQVAFTFQDSLARLLITDDGVGFDPDLLNPNDGGHYGLQFMRERAEQIGGRLQVESASEKGTRVMVEIPINNER